jgi:hypothetical protein
MLDDRIMLNFGGDIVLIPVVDLSSPSALRWWKSPAQSGDNPKLTARVVAAWQMYQSLTGQLFQPDSNKLKRNKLQFWLRCKLTKLGII